MRRSLAEVHVAINEGTAESLAEDRSCCTCERTWRALLTAFQLGSFDRLSEVLR